MPTIIKFTGANDNAIEVREDAESVSRALGGDGGHAVHLTRADDGTPVYVNPGAVACWFDGVRAPRPDSGVASSMSPL